MRGYAEAFVEAALAARGAQAGDERAAFEKAMLQAWKMSDPLHPPGQPGSYARGEYNGICAALQTVRENFDRALAARGAQAEPTAEQIKRLRDALEGECDGFDPSEDAARRVLRHLYGRQG
jgi:hypothetical protein